MVIYFYPLKCHFITILSSYGLNFRLRTLPFICLIEKKEAKQQEVSVNQITSKIFKNISFILRILLIQKCKNIYLQILYTRKTCFLPKHSWQANGVFLMLNDISLNYSILVRWQLSSKQWAHWNPIRMQMFVFQYANATDIIWRIHTHFLCVRVCLSCRYKRKAMFFPLRICFSLCSIFIQIIVKRISTDLINIWRDDWKWLRNHYKPAMSV